MTQFQRLAIHAEAGLMRNFWHKDLIRGALFHLRAPVFQLGVMCLLDMLHYGRGGNDLDVRPGFNDRLQTEVEIGIARGDHNLLQLFTALFNHLHQFLTILGAELGIKQNRFGWPGDQG